MPFNYRGHNLTAVVIRCACVYDNPPRGKRVRTGNFCVGVELTVMVSDMVRESEEEERERERVSEWSERQS